MVLNADKYFHSKTRKTAVVESLILILVEQELLILRELLSSPPWITKLITALYVRVAFYALWKTLA
jgi:hypothetical protein